jgi:hypothetical protein
VTYEELLERIISDGIAEVREAYAAPEDHHKRDGAIEGFEACRGKSPTAIVTMWSEAERSAEQVMRGDTRDYWRQRYKALQLEFVLNVISVGLVDGGHPPLLAHLPTTRGALKYAAIVGVRGGEETRSGGTP